MNTLQDKNYEKIWWFGLATLIAPPQPAQVEVSDVLKKIISNMLLSKIPQNRSVAVVTIAKFQIKEHVPKIIEIFPKETDSRIKRNIVIELSKVDDERAREFIVSILKNEDAELRLAACIGLSEFKNKISPELLAEIADNDPDKRVRTQAIEAILSTGDVRGLPFIKKFLDSVIFKKENETITSIFNGIPKIKDRKTIDFLEPYLKSDDSYIRFHCALAIGKIGLKEAAPILSKSLNDLDTGVKKQVIRSLGWIGNPESLEVLQKAHSKELDEDTKKEIQKAVELIKSGGRKWD